MKTQMDIQTNQAIGDRGLIHISRPDDTGDQPLPFVLFIHGGGWRAGDRNTFQGFAPAITDQGWAMVTCSYRLATEAIFPAAYDDLVHVMAWLREHGRSHGLDADKAFLMGSSAGGHLAALLATRVDFHDPKMTCVRAAAVFGGVYEMRTQEAHDVIRKANPAITFMGGGSDQFPDLYDAASPGKHIHKNMPPMFIFHGGADPTTPCVGTIEFARGLVLAGVPVTLRIDQGIGHTFMADKRPDGTSPGLRYAEDIWAMFEAQL